MIAFEEVERTVKEQHGSLIERHPGSAEACRHYKGRGGEGGWSTVGIYAYVAPERRIVLECLYLARYSACVIRVFEESPLKFFYERKATTAEACASRVGEALAELQMRLPRSLLSLREHEVSEAWGQEMSEVLAPIPPPVHYSSVPE